MEILTKIFQNVVIIELDGVDDEVREIKDTVDALSKSISDYYRKAQKGNGEN